MSRMKASRVVRNSGLLLKWLGLPRWPRPLLSVLRRSTERRRLPTRNFLRTVLALRWWRSSSSLAPRVCALSAFSFPKLKLLSALALGAVAFVKIHLFQTGPLRVVFHCTSRHFFATSIHLFRSVVTPHVNRPRRHARERLGLARRSRGRARGHSARVSAILCGGSPLMVRLWCTVSLHLRCCRVRTLRRCCGTTSRIVRTSMLRCLRSPEGLVLGGRRVHSR